MRVGIYNRFLATLGGGERYMLKVAEILGRDADVDVVSQAEVPPSLIFDRLGIDVSGLRFVTLPDPAAQTVESVSERYDIFINASHLDPIVSRAPRSALLVHFPSTNTPGWRGQLRRAVADRLLRPLFCVPIVEQGFDFPEVSDGQRFSWTFGDGRVAIPSLMRRPPTLQVPLGSFRHDGTGPEVHFFSGSERVGLAKVPPGGEFHSFAVRPSHRENGQFQLSIRSDTFTAPAEYNDPRALGVAVGQIRVGGGRGALYDLVFNRWRPELGQSLYGRKGGRLPDHVKSYDMVWTVSRFCRTWTRRYWGIDSSLINPPVDVEGIQSFGQVPKENIIVNVGRFFAGNHNKKHLEMISAFRRMLEQGLSGWTLVLVGGVSDDAVHRDYLRQVREAAEGLPVRIALDISYEELIELYARSAVYWHATGYGEDERRDPAAMEHFGITTVEAMAAGCVPVVINKAGQAEIVRHREDGLLWRDLDGLIEHTWSVVLDGELRSSLSHAARQRSMAFSGATFEQRLLELVNSLGLARSPDRVASGPG